MDPREYTIGFLKEATQQLTDVQRTKLGSPSAKSLRTLWDQIKKKYMTKRDVFQSIVNANVLKFADQLFSTNPERGASTDETYHKDILFVERTVHQIGLLIGVLMNPPHASSSSNESEKLKEMKLAMDQLQHELEKEKKRQLQYEIDHKILLAELHQSSEKLKILENELEAQRNLVKQKEAENQEIAVQQMKVQDLEAKLKEQVENNQQLLDKLQALEQLLQEEKSRNEQFVNTLNSEHEKERQDMEQIIVSKDAKIQELQSQITSLQSNQNLDLMDVSDTSLPKSITETEPSYEITVTITTTFEVSTCYF
jgi:myosin heavy subunit